jgi:hypothetical protein
MTVYYVATLARYVVVDAENESQARERGTAALYELYADVRARYGREVPIEIRVVRPANSDEIEMVRFHERMLANERRLQQRPAPVRIGDRIRLVAMPNDPAPQQVGELGTVTGCRRNSGDDGWFQIDVAWDNGRTLMLASPPDEFEIVSRGDA